MIWCNILTPVSSICSYNLSNLSDRHAFNLFIVTGLSKQQEVENFKKVHLISREQFDCLTPEPPVDPNQEVPPGPPRPQQSEISLYFFKQSVNYVRNSRFWLKKHDQL